MAKGRSGVSERSELITWIRGELVGPAQPLELPVVIGDPHVRFYAGIPLHAADGARVGAFCIVDSKPRSMSAAQLRMLKDIARLIEEELEPRAAAKAVGI